MLSLGACLVDAPERTFYAELRPVTERAVPEALHVSGFTLDQLDRTGRDPREAMGAFRNWVFEISTGMAPVFVGFNASFDWAFINWYFHVYVGDNPFGIGALDIKAYYMGFSRCRWRDTTFSRLPKEYQPDKALEHHALADAVAQAAIFDKLLHTLPN